MISIKDFMECIEYKITEGSDFLWFCFGNHAYSLSSDNNNGTVSIVFDRETQVVYEMQAWDYVNDREYRWIHPDYDSFMRTDAEQRSLDPDTSLDGKKFIDLDMEEDILEKSKSIIQGKSYDTRVLVNVEMDSELLHSAMLFAHEQDITLNEYIENILRDQIEKLKQHIS